MSSLLLSEVLKERGEAERTYIEKRRDIEKWRVAWRARDRWFGRWEDWAEASLLDMQSSIDIEAVGSLLSDSHVEKGLGRIILRRLRALLSGATTDWQTGAVKAYVGMAMDMGEDAGQFALDAIGIDRDFAWAHPRAMAADLFAVRGSKVIQHAHGSHMDLLTAMVVRATRPEAPKSVDELVKEIREAWPGIAKYQARRIARTETAIIWETTNLNTMVANGITKFEWITATGPSIGPPKSEAVCVVCHALAARSPWDVQTLVARGGLPPAHPNCRCTLLPVLVRDDGTPWLPPKEPWAGGTLDEPIPAPDFTAAITPAPRRVRIPA